MPAWSELQKKLSSYPDDTFFEWLHKVAEIREKPVIYYASGFLQKPGAGATAIVSEDMNGFMNALHGLGGDELTLILHTPGGDMYAVESIVGYLHNKFANIEVIVPLFAMSGGAMISLASNRIIMGKESQLGPIDPQFNVGGKWVAARDIIEAFRKAKIDITSNVNTVHLWAPILQHMAPSLMIEAQKSLDYGKSLVEKWLSNRMFANQRPGVSVEKIAAYFNAEVRKGERVFVHGQRIGFEKLRELGLIVDLLEDDQDLQDAVLTTYHAMTLIFEKTPSTKFIATTNNNKMWVKSL